MRGPMPSKRNFLSHSHLNKPEVVHVANRPLLRLQNQSRNWSYMPEGQHRAARTTLHLQRNPISGSALVRLSFSADARRNCFSAQTAAAYLESGNAMAKTIASTVPTRSMPRERSATTRCDFSASFIPSWPGIQTFQLMKRCKVMEMNAFRIREKVRPAATICSYYFPICKIKELNWC